MRKPRDYDADLKALEDKAKTLRTRKVMQHGELIAATGADAIDPDLLAGGLVALAKLTDGKRKEELREMGAAFFRRGSRKASRGASRSDGGAQALDRDAPPSRSEAGAA